MKSLSILSLVDDVAHLRKGSVLFPPPSALVHRETIDRRHPVTIPSGPCSQVEHDSLSFLLVVDVFSTERDAGHDHVNPAHGVGNRRVDGRDTLAAFDTPGHGANLRESTTYGEKSKPETKLIN